MKFDSFYHRGRKTEVCPFNNNILCTDHNGQYPLELPEVCSSCGWNPEEWKRRVKEVNEHGMERRSASEA